MSERDKKANKSCLKENHLNCGNCGTAVCLEKIYWVGPRKDIPSCGQCYQNYYYDNLIHSTNYKPIPLYHGKGSYYGVELDVDCGGNDARNASKVLAVANSERDNIYIRQNNSLVDGFTVVSHPMSLKYHLDVMPWAHILKELDSLNYLSHNMETCDCRINVERKCLGSDDEQRCQVIANILYFIEKFWGELLRFGRRDSGVSKGFLRKPDEIFISIKRNKLVSGCLCLDLQDYGRVCFRMFKGSLTYNTFISMIQMVDEICHVSVELSFNEMENLTWQYFIESIDREAKKELVSYLKLKGLC